MPHSEAMCGRQPPVHGRVRGERHHAERRFFSDLLVRDGYRARAFDWTTTYSPNLAKDWLGKQDRTVQDAIRAFNDNGGLSATFREDEGLVRKFAEYLELKTAANQKYKGQLFYFLNPKNHLEVGLAVYRFPTTTSTIDATGKEVAGEGADIKFDQPSRDVQVAGVNVTLPSYVYSVAFNRTGGSDVLTGDLRHPETGTLLGRSELTPKWGLGL